MSPYAAEADIRALLAHKTIAVVGLSDDPSRDSYRVAAYMQAAGYRIVPVNPKAASILGETAYPTLAAIPFAVDVVDVFRRLDAVPAVTDEAVAVGAKGLWLQLGLTDPASADRARAAGLTVVMDRCPKIEHARLRAAGLL